MLHLDNLAHTLGQKGPCKLQKIPLRNDCAVGSLRDVQTNLWIAKLTDEQGSGVGVQHKEILKHLPRSFKSSLPIAIAVGRVSASVHAAGQERR